MYSLIIPVYKNEGSIPDLLEAVSAMNTQLHGQLELVFVVDGSPDQSHALLESRLSALPLNATLLLLSRNFGSFAAIRAGLAEASGPYFAVMAADLQEPPELVLEFFRTLESEPVDVVVGTREKRDDPVLSRIAAHMFWGLYRRLVQKEMPSGGVDVFGCNTQFRDRLLVLGESNSSLVGLLFWLGFRRKQVAYRRLPRLHGQSAWSLRRKLRYLSDSVFAFSDLPIRLLVLFGVLGMFASLLFSAFILAARFGHWIVVPGYATTMAVLLFFLAFNAFGLGVIGSYVWRAFENSKGRPLSIVMLRQHFNQKP